MIDLAAIGLSVLIVLWRYRKGYYDGLYASLFFLVLCPNNMSIELGTTLPSVTIHRIIIVIMFLKAVGEESIVMSPKNVPFINILFVITATMGISTLISDDFLVSFKRYLYFIVETVVFYVIMSSSIKSRDHIVSICKVVALSLVVVALFGIYEKYTDFNPTTLFGRKHTYSFEVVREMSSRDVTSTFIHRILFGTAMAVGLMNSIFLCDLVAAGRARLFAWLSIGLLGTGLYFSLSRGPWLAFILSSSLVFVFCFRPVGKRLMAIGMMAGLMFLMRPGTAQTIEALYSSTYQEGSVKASSYQWRFMVLETAYTNIVDAKSVLITLFGNGEGSHVFKQFKPIRLPTGFLAYFKSWDNEYAVILFERGLIGLFLILFLYGKFMVKGVLYCLHAGEQKFLVLIACSCCLVIFIMNFSVRIFAPQIVYLQYVYMAIGSSLFYGKVSA